MYNKSPIELLRILRIKATYGILLGKPPERPQLKTSGHIVEPLRGAVSLGIIIGLIVSIGFEIIIWVANAFELIKINTIFRGTNLFFWATFIAFIVILLLPYITFIIGSLRYGIRKSALNFQNNLFFDKLYAHMILSFCIVMTFSPYLAPHFKAAGVKFKDFEIMIFCWIVFTLSLPIFMWILPHLIRKNEKQNPGLLKRMLRKTIPISKKEKPFGLWLGTSTGRLATLYHQAGLAPNQQIALFNDDAAQNILVLGAIGSGKTTCVIHPLLLQLLEQGCGGLIFDMKADFKYAVARGAQLTNRSYITIGAGATQFNLLEGLTPEVASSHLKSGILLSDVGDSFWADTAAELCRNALGVLSFLPEYYNLNGLYKLLFLPDFSKQIQAELDVLKLGLSTWDKRRLESYDDYLTHVFGKFDDKVQSNVKATLAQVLSPFSHPTLIDAFCTKTTIPMHFEDLIDGQIVLVDLPLSIWGLGAKIVYTLIKLRFFNLMQTRNTKSELNQDRYVFFLCDEYQEIISASKTGLSDLNFWDKARTSKTVGIISAQAVSSFYAALPSRDLADAVIQNFRQKICFRTEDRNTIELFNRLLGSVETLRMSYSQNIGASYSSGSQGGSSSHQDGSSKSLSTHDKALLDGQFFRQLGKGEALVCLSMAGMGMDDVIKVTPYYFQQEELVQKEEGILAE